jgi:hypothetical protein
VKAVAERKIEAGGPDVDRWAVQHWNRTAVFGGSLEHLAPDDRERAAEVAYQGCSDGLWTRAFAVATQEAEKAAAAQTKGTGGGQGKKTDKKSAPKAASKAAPKPKTQAKRGRAKQSESGDQSAKPATAAKQSEVDNDPIELLTPSPPKDDNAQATSVTRRVERPSSSDPGPMITSVTRSEAPSAEQDPIVEESTQGDTETPVGQPKKKARTSPAMDKVSDASAPAPKARGRASDPKKQAVMTAFLKPSE